MASMLIGLLPTCRPTLRPPLPGRSSAAVAAGAVSEAGASAASGAGFSGTNLYCWILPCSSSRPWNSASGRGGQPGMYTSTGTTLSTPLTTL